MKARKVSVLVLLGVSILIIGGLIGVPENAVFATSIADSKCMCTETNSSGECINWEYYQENNPTNCYCSGAWGNCVWWALYRRPDIINAHFDSINANWDNEPYKWDSYASQKGYTVSGVPKAGSIAIFEPGVQGASSLGHVAYVTDVADTPPTNTSNFTVSEMNCGQNGVFTKTNYTADKNVGVHFIYQPPAPKLVSDVAVAKNPAHPGQVNKFSFKLKNTSGSKLVLQEIFVEGHLQDGNIWRAWDDSPDNIPAGSTVTYVGTAVMWGDKPGVWTIDKIVYRDGNGNLHTLGSNGYIIEQKFLMYPEGTVVKKKYSKSLYYLETNTARPLDNRLTYSLLGAPAWKEHSVSLVDRMTLGSTLSSRMQVGKTGGVTHEWRHIAFPTPYPSAPVVLAQIVSEVGPDNSHIDIKSVTGSGFYVRVEEDLPLNGTHPNGEVVHWMAIPPGGFGILKAGKTGFIVTHNWFQVNFSEPFSTTPVIVAQITSEKGGDNSHIDIKDTSSTGFYARVEEDLMEDGTHPSGEQIHWMAVPKGVYYWLQAGRVGAVTHLWKKGIYATAFSETPIFVGQIVTESGPHNCHVDFKGINATSFTVRVEEDTELDGTHYHGERIEYIAIKP